MDSFRKNILQFNHQLGRSGLGGYNLEKLKNRRFDGLIIYGMGGSGLAGEILKSVKEEIGLKLPIIIWKDYGLPACRSLDGGGSRAERPDSPFKNPLHIFVSFSGATEETLSGIKSLLKAQSSKPRLRRDLGGQVKANLAAITSGGELKKIVLQNRLPLILFPAADLTPRQAVGRMFYGLVKILEAAGFRLKVKEFTGLQPTKFEVPGGLLARKLKNRFVLIYTDQKNYQLGYIWKIKFNETAKTPAFNNVLPEMNHNEIVGFEKAGGKFAAIFLNDAANFRIRKRFALTEKLLKEKGVLTLKLALIGSSKLEKIWNALILADWTTYFLAKLNRFDPAKTEIIAKLKKLMK